MENDPEKSHKLIKAIFFYIGLGIALTFYSLNWVISYANGNFASKDKVEQMAVEVHEIHEYIFEKHR